MGDSLLSIPSHMKTYRKIIRDAVKYPSNFSESAKLFVCGLLQKKRNHRLGIVRGGSARIKQHRWFDGFSWTKLECRTMKPPFVPKVKGKLDCSNFDKYEDSSKGRLSVFEITDFSKLTAKKK